jgi:excisionase family DNA binding protein
MATTTTIDKLLLTISEAASALHIGRSKLYELIASGELEVVHIGRSVRVPRAAIEAFVEQLRSGRPSTVSHRVSILGSTEGSAH